MEENEETKNAPVLHVLVKEKGQGKSVLVLNSLIKRLGSLCSESMGLQELFVPGPQPQGWT